MAEARKEDEILDVAIVGGGISGIYTGWRLLTADLQKSDKLRAWAGKNNGKLRVAVFEGSDRIGGRLLSARSRWMPHVTCEVGGMRYVSSQKRIKSLVENKLRLASHPQVVFDPMNIAYLRGKHLRIGELRHPMKLPYNLQKLEADWVAICSNNDPSGLIVRAINQLLPGTRTLSGEDVRNYLQNAKLYGTPLWEYGFWNMLARAMSSEAYQLARATVGYDALGLNANAVDLTAEIFDFTPNVKYSLLDNGYDAVPVTLESEFSAAGGKVFKKGAWLDSFDALDDGVVLRFRDGRKEVKARAIVLAMPRRSIQLLRREGPVLNPSNKHVQWLLDSVQPVALYKMFIVYPCPWWESAGVQQGRSLTDIPLRQCYYWGVEGNQKGADPSDKTATIMAYNDVSSVEFWNGLRFRTGDPCSAEAESREGVNRVGGNLTLNQRMLDRRRFERQTPPQPLRPPINAGVDLALSRSDELATRLSENWNNHCAPHDMVMAMHRQLIELHGLASAPDPIDAAYMDWSDDPFGAGVHFWNSGYKSWEILEAMTQPVDNFPCYVCGEAYSTNQTWVEGALQTSEIVLQKHFGLGPPDWLKETD